MKIFQKEIKDIAEKGVPNALDTTGVDEIIEQAVESLDTFGTVAFMVTDFDFSIPFEINL